MPLDFIILEMKMTKNIAVIKMISDVGNSGTTFGWLTRNVLAESSIKTNHQDSYTYNKNKYFPNYIVRTRRDYGHFLAIVESVAFLHQKQREKIELHDQKYIRATLADAYMAKIIVENSLSKSIYELPEKTIEVIEVARVLIEELKKDAKNMGWKKTMSQLCFIAVAEVLVMKLLLII